MARRDQKVKRPQNGSQITLNRKKLSRAIRERRVKVGYTLRDLEGVVGVSYPTLCRIERCEIANPEVGHLLAICQWLRRPPESFYDGVLVPLRTRIHYKTSVNAGDPAPTFDELEARDLCEDLMPDQDEYFTVTAKGDSM